MSVHPQTWKRARRHLRDPSEFDAASSDDKRVEVLTDEILATSLLLKVARRKEEHGCTDAWCSECEA